MVNGGAAAQQGPPRDRGRIGKEIQSGFETDHERRQGGWIWTVAMAMLRRSVSVRVRRAC